MSPAGKHGRQVIGPHRRLFQGKSDARTGLPRGAPADRIDDDEVCPLFPRRSFCPRLPRYAARGIRSGSTRHGTAESLRDRIALALFLRSQAMNLFICLLTSNEKREFRAASGDGFPPLRRPTVFSFRTATFSASRPPGLLLLPECLGRFLRRPAIVTTFLLGGNQVEGTPRFEPTDLIPVERVDSAGIHRPCRPHA